ncbi:hypothetical protein Pmani_004278 [Petrolisthes manimaculis]|uniref:Regulatory protein zeste n=1 Tax=Petrolisthes manimaculis TaxID=1843537 RepID=A0AAE1QEK9_9EUCA|nr:hypothetical protein Pmani_004278 [Petrolisthes manimaculis]
MLLQEVDERRKVIMGALSPRITAKAKDNEWKAVTEAVNSISRVSRDVLEIRKKFRTFRSEVKKKAAKEKSESGSDRLRPIEYGQPACAQTRDSHPVHVLVYLGVTSQGKMQLCSGDDYGISQQTAGRIINQTLDALATPAFLVRCIKFPTTQAEIQQKQAEFRGIANFPGVVGFIDGSHIRIVAPKEYEAEYVNRKNYHSINIQLVFDAQYRILDVVVLARWPGSVHDSRIWNDCGLKGKFERGIIPGGCHLLGDSGYPCQPWLLTPYLQPRNVAQEAYNRAHKRTRCVVERGIGQLKRRFHVLHGEIRVDQIKTSKIVMVCAALHNLCKERNLGLPDEYDGYEAEPVEANPIQHDCSEQKSVTAEAAEDIEEELTISEMVVSALDWQEPLAEGQCDENTDDPYGDSSVYRAVCAMNGGKGHYGEHRKDEKAECMNHVAKRLGTGLRGLKMTGMAKVEGKAVKKQVTSCLFTDCPNVCHKQCLIDPQATFDCDTVGELRQHHQIPDPVTYLNTHTQNSPNSNVPACTSEEEELLNLDTRELVNIIQSLRRDNWRYKLTLSYFDRTSKDLAVNRDAVVTVLNLIDNIAATQTSLNNLTVNSIATSAKESNIDKDWQKLLTNNKVTRDWWNSDKPRRLQKHNTDTVNTGTQVNSPHTQHTQTQTLTPNLQAPDLTTLTQVHSPDTQSTPTQTLTPNLQAPALSTLNTIT